MPLSIASRPDRNYHVLTVVGNLTLGPHLKSLQQMARVVLDGGPPDGLILDVSGLRYTDSAGLGELTILYTLCNKKHCVLVLIGVPAQLKQMLELTRLDALLPSAPDVEAAKRHVKLQLQKQRGVMEAHDAVAGE
jgi:anti-sigma B factor antagonist